MSSVFSWSLANPVYRVLSWTLAICLCYFGVKILTFGYLTPCWFMTSIILALISLEALRDYYRISSVGRAVFITGCDSGFGLHFAEHIANKGFFVFAGVLSLESEGAKYLKDLFPERLLVSKLDVTSESDVKETFSQVEKTLKEKRLRLWAVVNNAGVSRSGPFEFVTDEDYQVNLNVNLLGVVKVSKQFLPLLRASKGRIINVTSVASILGSPISAPYTVSKFALEGLTQCMAYELQSMGITVIAVEPSYFVKCTNFLQGVKLMERLDQWQESLTEEQKTVYNNKYFKDLKKICELVESGGPPNDDLVMEALELSVCCRYPSYKYLAMGVEGLIMHILAFLPNIFSKFFYGFR